MPLKQKMPLFCISLCLIVPTFAHADAKGKALLQQVLKANRAAKTLSGTLLLKRTEDKKTSTSEYSMKLQMPNRFAIVPTKASGADNVAYVSDGKQGIFYYASRKTYRKYRVDSSSPTGLPLVLGAGFLDSPATAEGGIEPKYIGKESVQGKTCDVLEFTTPSEDKVRISISPEKLVLRRVRTFYVAMENKRQLCTEEETLQNYKTRAVFPQGTFSFKIPKGTKPDQEDAD